MKQVILKDTQPTQVVEVEDLQINGNEEHFLIAIESQIGKRYIVKLKSYYERKWVWLHPSDLTNQGSTRGYVFDCIKEFLNARLNEGFKVYFWTSSEYKEYLRWLANEKEDQEFN